MVAMAVELRGPLVPSSTVLVKSYLVGLGIGGWGVRAI